MARNDDCDGISPIGQPNGPRGAGCTDLFGDFSVGASFAVRNRQQRLPHSLLELSAPQIELEIEGVGRLAFNVKDELKRTWKRETRLQMHEKAAQKTPGAYPDITPQLTGKHAPAAR